jgi:hypothetical protein
MCDVRQSAAISVLVTDNFVRINVALNSLLLLATPGARQQFTPRISGVAQRSFAYHVVVKLDTWALKRVEFRGIWNRTATRESVKLSVPKSQKPSGSQFLADEERKITAASQEGQGHFVAKRQNLEAAACLKIRTERLRPRRVTRWVVRLEDSTNPTE